MTFQDWYDFPLLAYSGTNTRYNKLVYPYTHTDIQRGWYAGIIEFNWCDTQQRTWRHTDIQTDEYAGIIAE